MDIRICVNKNENIFRIFFAVSDLITSHCIMRIAHIWAVSDTSLITARVVKLVDTTDLKSVGWVKPPYRFDSGSGHHYPYEVIA